jgi:scyllo-inositol 2-dehydrogenase (NAD+)
VANLRGAVVGCGRMGAFTSPLMQKWAPSCWHPLSHCEAISTTSGIELSAVCDVDEALLSRVTALYPTTRAFRSHTDLIDQIAPDILGIATRTPQRPGIIEYAVSNGVRGLHLEKPLCNSLSELDRLQLLLESREVACTYGTLRRYIPIFALARGLALSGRFGPLQQIEVRFGAASLMWTHPHSFDLLLFMAGDADVSTVSARFAATERRGAQLDGDPIVRSVLVEFATGVTGLISQAGGNDVTLSCRDGAVTVESGGRRIRWRESSGGGDPYWDAQGVDAFVGGEGGTRLAVERLVGALGGTSPEHAAADRRALLMGHRVLLAAVQSHLEDGRATRLDQLDPTLAVSGRGIEGRFA